jgi:hypothetical protein
MVFPIIQQLDFVTGQKNHSSMKEVVTNTNFMEFQLIDAWNFHRLACIVKTDVCIVGDQWNFMIQ